MQNAWRNRQRNHRKNQRRDQQRNKRRINDTIRTDVASMVGERHSLADMLILAQMSFFVKTFEKISAMCILRDIGRKTAVQKCLNRDKTKRNMLYLMLEIESRFAQFIEVEKQFA